MQKMFILMPRALPHCGHILVSSYASLLKHTLKLLRNQQKILIHESRDLALYASCQQQHINRVVSQNLIDHATHLNLGRIYDCVQSTAQQDCAVGFCNIYCFYVKDNFLEGLLFPLLLSSHTARISKGLQQDYFLMM